MKYDYCQWMIFERPITSGNRLTGRPGERSSGWRYIKERKAWAALVPALPFNVRRETKRGVHVLRLMGKGQREYDDENLLRGVKALMDALVVAGFLKNDSPKWRVLSYDQLRAEVPEPVVRTIIVLHEPDEEVRETVQYRQARAAVQALHQRIQGRPA